MISKFNQMECFGRNISLGNAMVFKTFFNGIFIISILKQVVMGWHFIPRFKPLTQKQSLSSVHVNCIRQASKRGANISN